MCIYVVWKSPFRKILLLLLLFRPTDPYFYPLLPVNQIIELVSPYQIYVGAVSFESSAEIYNSVHGILGSKKAMNPDRPETEFFLYQITRYVKVLHWHRTVKNKDVDVKRIAEDQYAEIRDAIDRKWLEHSCKDVGCKNKFIVLDGNEKLFRLKCYEDGCINNPIRGNQFGSGSTKCASHDTINSNKHKKTKCASERLELRPVTRSMTSTADVLTSGEGCKDEKAIMKFHDRSAGMIYIFRPCGIRLTHCEMIVTPEPLYAHLVMFFHLLHTKTCQKCKNFLIFTHLKIPIFLHFGERLVYTTVIKIYKKFFFLF